MKFAVNSIQVSWNSHQVSYVKQQKKLARISGRPGGGGGGGVGKVYKGVLRGTLTAAIKVSLHVY